jgi:AP endonuclease-1
MDSKPAKPIARTAAKRKAADSQQDAEEPLEQQKNKKQRKTKAQIKAEEEAMVLAERTAVSSLTRAMYIGAHVSAAGGKHTNQTLTMILCPAGQGN